MPTVTDISFLINKENSLQRIAKVYDVNDRLIIEYKTISDPTPGTTECLKRAYIYDANDNIVGQQVKVEVWTQAIHDISSPPITDIQVDNLTINPSLPTGTKVGDITVTGGVAPFTIELTSNPGNLFRIDNGNELTLNASSQTGSYPITIQVTDDDGKQEDQNFTVIVLAFNTKSLEFDGTDEFINYGSDSSLNITDSLTVACWIKTTDTTNSKCIASKWLTQGDEQVWYIGKTAAAPTVLRVLISGIGSFGSGQSKEFRGETNITDGEWHLVGFSYENNSLELYVDGTLESATEVINQSMTLLYSTTAANVLSGALYDGSGNPAQFWLGNQDEFSVWNRALDSDEWAELYNSGDPANPNSHSASADLVSSWRMGDGDTLPTIIDHTGSNNGTAVNMEDLDIKEDVP